MGPFSR